jgi:multidrug efflux pump
MNPSAPFVRRPIATLLLAFGVLLIGAVSYSRLPIASLPAVERPTITVYAQLPGASADTIASALAQPLERELGVIPGIIEMASYSTTSGTQITIQFNLEKDIDAAGADVQAAINAAGPNLPKDLPAPPYFRKVNPSGYAPVALALTSDLLNAGEVYDYADSVVVQKLSELPGVAQVYVTGGEKTAVRIQALPQPLANMNLSLEDVRIAIRAATQNLPLGSINIGDRSHPVGANEQLFKAEDYQPLVLAYRDGAPVRLRDVASVTDSVINNKLAGWFGNERAVLAFVMKQPDANVVEIVDGVKALIPQLERWLPPAVKLHLLYDRTMLIRASVADVQLTIEIAIILVVLVVALFLRRLWATLIPGFTIPLALAATFVVMNLAGYSLDNLSLMAIAISIGFIVDDAVIIVENVSRLRDEGNGAVEASLIGSQQMSFTVISITGALLGALLPVLFMPDIVGRYFREFAVTLATAIIASAIVSLTLTPMLCSRWHTSGPTRSRRLEQYGSIALRTYMRSLDWALTHPTVIVLLLLMMFGSTVCLYWTRPKGFMPTQDIGILTVRTITIANVSFTGMEQLQRTVANVVLQDPAVAGLSSYIATDNGSQPNAGTIYVNLKPLDERRESIQAVIARLREELGKIAGIRSFLTPWQDLVFGVQGTAARYQFTLTGSDPDAVWRWSETMRRRMLAMSEVTDVVTSAEVSGLEAGLVIDRERAAAFGVTPLAIDNTLYDAFGQRQIKTIYLPFNFSRIILEVDPASQTDPSLLGKIFVGGGGKAQVPLGALMRPRRAHGPIWIRHSELFPSVTLSFDTRPGVSIGDAIDAIRAAQADVLLPDDIKADFRGEAAEATKSRMKQALLYLGAVFAVYVILGILYESFVHPFTILTALPSAVFGALLALTVTNAEFTLVTSIACMLIVGIAMKNAIMMVDFALATQRSARLSAAESIRQAAQLRVRPILMTSLVATLSAVPLAIGTGPGHELRQPLGIACVGGLLVSQFLTLYSTPVIFTLVERLRMGRKHQTAPRSAGHPLP